MQRISRLIVVFFYVKEFCYAALNRPAKIKTPNKLLTSYETNKKRIRREEKRKLAMHVKKE
jgi:hypothetical protein